MSIVGIGQLATKMGLDPLQFSSLERIQQILAFVSESLYRDSVALGAEREPFPGLKTRDLFALVPERGLERELSAKIDAHGTRNSQIVALSPFAVIPDDCPPTEIRDFSNLLPVMKFAHVLACRKPHWLARIGVENLELFLRLSVGILPDCGIGESLNCS